MRYMSALYLILLCLRPSLHAEPPVLVAKERITKETWDAAYLEGAKCGSFHSKTVEIERDGAKLLRTTLTMDLRIRRYNAVVPLKMDTGDEERLDGTLSSLFLTQFADKGSLTQTGVVQGKDLVVGVAGQKETRRVPWDPSIIGLAKQDAIFRERKVKPGDTFTFKNFELSLLTAVTVRVAVKDYEETDLLAPKKVGQTTTVERVKKKLLRVEAVPDKVEIDGNVVPLPRLVTWLDDKLEGVRSEMEMPGLGTIVLYRTTQAIAEEEGAAPALLPDLGLTTLIPLNQRIAHPHEASGLVYRVTVKGDADPATTFVRDARQTPSDAKGASFTLTVHPLATPADATPGKPAKEEFTKSSYFIDSDDEKVRELASDAVGREADAWRKAQRLEKWVHEHMTGSSAVGFVPASQVARDLKGDCRQHAMLTAAMCRAVGVPARTAVGLVYVDDPERGPLLGFHMWTEVYARGQWLGLDATLGRGRVGPAHLKIADASWHDTQTLAPLLPVTRVMGRLAIEVVKVEEN